MESITFPSFSVSWTPFVFILSLIFIFAPQKQETPSKIYLLILSFYKPFVDFPWFLYVNWFGRRCLRTRFEKAVDFSFKDLSSTPRPSSWIFHSTSLKGCFLMMWKLKSYILNQDGIFEVFLVLNGNNKVNWDLTRLRHGQVGANSGFFKPWIWLKVATSCLLHWARSKCAVSFWVAHCQI